MTTIPGDPLRGAACPHWCTAEHHEQHHEDNCWHTSPPPWLPVVELIMVRQSNGLARFDAVSVDLTTGVEQRVDADEPFITPGVSDQGARSFRLSRESAHRLTVAPSAVLHTFQER